MLFWKLRCAILKLLPGPHCSLVLKNYQWQFIKMHTPLQDILSFSPSFFSTSFWHSHIFLSFYPFFLAFFFSPSILVFSLPLYPSLCVSYLGSKREQSKDNLSKSESQKKFGGSQYNKQILLLVIFSSYKIIPDWASETEDDTFTVKEKNKSLNRKKKFCVELKILIAIKHFNYWW